MDLGPTLFGENMQCEDFLTAFCCLLFVIERSKEICAAQHGVVGPLFCCMEEECVAKETKAFLLLGQQWHCFFARGKGRIHKKLAEAVCNQRVSWRGHLKRSKPRLWCLLGRVSLLLHCHFDETYAVSRIPTRMKCKHVYL